MLLQHVFVIFSRYRSLEKERSKTILCRESEPHTQLGRVYLIRYTVVSFGFSEAHMTQLCLQTLPERLKYDSSVHKMDSRGTLFDRIKFAKSTR